MYGKIVTVLIYAIARKAPKVSRKYIRSTAKRALPQGYPVDVHFKPRYDPWDQRLCLMLDNDFYEAIGDGRVDVVTDQIDHVDATGVVLGSGERIDADVIVTATGIQLQALGGVALSIDGAEVKPQDGSSTRSTCSRTCRTRHGASATSTRRGRCGRI